MRLRAPTKFMGSEQGSLFVMVMWISFGLVVLSLHFANSMSMEMRGSENRLASAQANAAITGAARYASYVLETLGTNGVIPDIELYASEWVPVGDARFWFLGERVEALQQSEWIPAFGLVDESSKLNLNSATAEMLQTLPGMTVEFAAAIVDWRDADSDASESGAEDESYQRLNPPRRCKNAPFESVDELRLVYGATIELIYGEDANRNGILDANENDGQASLPYDNADGRLDRGIASFVTVHTKQPTTKADGTAFVSVSNRQELSTLLEERFGEQRASQITAGLGGPNTQFQSLLQFYVASEMSSAEFTQIEGDIIASTNVVQGLVNVNTASEEVLACLPGIGVANAATLISARPSDAALLSSVAWVKDALDTDVIAEAGRFLTGRSYQFTADVVAVGRYNRGFRRTRFVFDMGESPPRITFRQDLSHLGWALGERVRENLLAEMRSQL